MDIKEEIPVSNLYNVTLQDECNMPAEHAIKVSNNIKLDNTCDNDIKVNIAQYIDQSTTMENEKETYLLNFKQEEIYIKDEIPASNVLHNVTLQGTDDIRTQHVTDVICDKLAQKDDQLLSYCKMQSKSTSNHCNKTEPTLNLKAFKTSTQLASKGQYFEMLYNSIKNKSFVCNVCDYKTVKRSDFTRHVKTHTGEKSFACNLCEFKTSQKSHLKEHIRKHTGEKPFACNLCDYKTVRRSTLNCHLRTHSEEKPIACNLCDFKTRQKSDLGIHFRTHTGEKPFVCNVCDFQTIRKSKLTIHMRIHTGEKPYVCDVCDYKAAHVSNLKRHIRTHTGKKPFSCNLCDFKGKRKVNIDNHMRVHAEKL